jgi:hypothetical protein
VEQSTDSRGLKPASVSAKATLRNVDFDPRYDGDKQSGFVCKYAFVPAVAAAQ